jgi:spermidine synthase
VLFLLFFLSGLSGLVYQVVWVREFSTSFGATIHTASLVVAIFMLGIGAGSYLVGLWADRRYARAPESLLRAYGVTELLIAALGLGVSLALPHLQTLAASSSSYVRGADGWFVLSRASYVKQAAIAFALLAPITVLMGGTLTLLIRHRVRADVDTAAGWKIAALYAVNTFGAAAGAFLTDFALVPQLGLRQTQFTAVVLNLIAGVGAIVLAASGPPEGGHYRRKTIPSSLPAAVVSGFSRTEPVIWTALALLLAGFAGMGMEIVWLRHFTVLLGGFRAVFSLLLTILLGGIGIGALAGGIIARRVSSPARALIVVETLFVLTVLAGLASNSAAAIAALHAAGLPEFWFNARPMLLEAGLPSILIGATFPLGNAIVQHAERTVGRRAGLLYLANTLGAVCGSLAAGYVLLPRFGMQGSAAALALCAGLTIAPLFLLDGGGRSAPLSGDRARVAGRAVRRGSMLPAAIAVAVVGIAIDAWMRMPESYILQRSLPVLTAPEKLVSVREGVTEVVAVTEIPGRGRGLLTNGHAMSSTAPLDQRYMRALAHIPLLLMESSPPVLLSSAVERSPTRVLVIGFGVGNSTHAATLHPGVERVDVADVSRQILEFASAFRAANDNVLRDPRVAVYINDGRQHLQMQRDATYDLITLEPPPIAHAGVGALYSREFYELARTRLKRGGYLSQWLPVYQVPPATGLAMVRAFVDVFPQSVLLSGTAGELLLVGTTGSRLEIDPEQLARRLEREPKVLADLRRLDLGTVKEIVGTFVGASDTLAKATRDSAAVSDDRPLQEYGVHSVLTPVTMGVPAALVDLPSAAQWCPRCFDGEQSTPAAEGLDAYLALMDEAYHASGDVRLKPDTTRGISVVSGFSRTSPAPRILGSAYLAAVLPDTAAVHNIVGVTLLDARRYEEAAAKFREALARREDSADANRNLGTALAATGHVEEAITYLSRAVQLAPGNAFARKELDYWQQRSRLVR